VNPEEGQVNDEWPDNQTDDAIEKVFVNVLLSVRTLHSFFSHHVVSTLDIQDTPEVPKHGRSDRQKGEEPNHLAPERTRERGAGSEQPEPPLLAEFAVSLLMELDVAEE